MGVSDYDPEEIFGSAFVDAVKRAAVFFVVAWVGSGIGFGSAGFPQIVGNLLILDFGEAKNTLMDLLRICVRGPINVFTFTHLVLTLLVTVISILICVKSELGSRWPFAVIMIMYSLLAISGLSSFVDSPWWAISLIYIFSCVSLFLLSRTIDQFQQNRFAHHIAEISAGNALKRQDLKREFGTAMIARNEEGHPDHRNL